MLSSDESYQNLYVPCRAVNIVDPNKIFVILGNISATIAAIQIMEEEIAGCFKSSAKSQNFRYPKKNDLVAFYHPICKKYFRAVVDFIVPDQTTGFETFICWAIDYGYSVRTTAVSHLIPLPEKFKTIDSPIAEVCLPLLPIPDQLVFRGIPLPPWSNLCIRELNASLGYDIFQLKFNELGKIDGVHYGNILYVRNNDNQVYSALHTLVVNGVAIDAGENLSEFAAGMCKNARNRRQNVECRKVSGVCHCEDV